MDDNDNAGSLTPSGVLESIASKLAPTGGRCCSKILCPSLPTLYQGTSNLLIAGNCCQGGGAQESAPDRKISGHNKNPQRKPS
ncbi:hypothetical protein C1X65_27980 [Pseudomonas sp. FW305-70]|nr:hypothetical protein C1X65_27980 [Pseudomonas sp. FW305-70]